MTVHEIEVDCTQRGTLVMRHEYVSFQTESQSLGSSFECSCGEEFTTKEGAVNHLQNNV
jgi:hypothetical protein